MKPCGLSALRPSHSSRLAESLLAPTSTRQNLDQKHPSYIQQHRQQLTARPFPRCSARATLLVASAMAPRVVFQVRLHEADVNRCLLLILQPKLHIVHVCLTCFAFCPQEVATSPEQHPLLPRSGASAATLPPWHTDDMIMVGGYTEEPLVPGEYRAHGVGLLGPVDRTTRCHKAAPHLTSSCEVAVLAVQPVEDLVHIPRLHRPICILRNQVLTCVCTRVVSCYGCRCAPQAWPHQRGVDLQLRQRGQLEEDGLSRGQPRAPGASCGVHIPHMGSCHGPAVHVPYGLALSTSPHGVLLRSRSARAIWVGTVCELWTCQRPLPVVAVPLFYTNTSCRETR